MVEFNSSSNQPFFLILGPPNAGKTTLMYRLYSGIFYNNTQVDNRDAEEVRVDNVRLRTLNILENNLEKEIWAPLALGSSGIIFIVDITSIDITDTHTLFQVIKSIEDVKQLPLLIFANKIDLQQYNEVKLLKDLNLPGKHQDNTLKIQKISCKTTEGIIKGMEWFMGKTRISFYIPAFRKQVKL